MELYSLHLILLDSVGVSTWDSSVVFQAYFDETLQCWSESHKKSCDHTGQGYCVKGEDHRGKISYLLTGK